MPTEARFLAVSSHVGWEPNPAFLEEQPLKDPFYAVALNGSTSEKTWVFVFFSLERLIRRKKPFDDLFQEANLQVCFY